MTKVLEEAQAAVEHWRRLYEQERSRADRFEEENRDLYVQLDGLRHVMAACAIKPPTEIEVPPALPENLSELPVLNLDEFYEDQA